MNERIKELWEESTVSMWPRPGKFTAGEYDYHLKKFAELIVKECAQVAFEGDLKRAIGQWGSHSDILKHFEVEHDVVKTFRRLKNEPT
jgi:hypothetical protein